MRISDWSSDVCSSDLGGRPDHRRRTTENRGAVCAAEIEADGDDRRLARRGRERAGQAASRGSEGPVILVVAEQKDRSEEHTSELQSLMRISYAVFCLKKKKKTK